MQAALNGKHSSPAPTAFDLARQKAAENRTARAALRVEIDGHTFATKAIGDRYLKLKKLQEQEKISGLKVKKLFSLYAHGPDGKKQKLGRNYSPLFSYYVGEELFAEDDNAYEGLNQHKQLLRDIFNLQAGISVVDIARG